MKRVLLSIIVVALLIAVLPIHHSPAQAQDDQPRVLLMQPQATLRVKPDPRAESLSIVWQSRSNPMWAIGKSGTWILVVTWQDRLGWLFVGETDVDNIEELAVPQIEAENILFDLSAPAAQSIVASYAGWEVTIPAWANIRSAPSESARILRSTESEEVWKSYLRIELSGLTWYMMAGEELAFVGASGLLAIPEARYLAMWDNKGPVYFARQNNEHWELYWGKELITTVVYSHEVAFGPDGDLYVPLGYSIQAFRPERVLVTTSAEWLILEIDVAGNQLLAYSTVELSADVSYQILLLDLEQEGAVPTVKVEGPHFMHSPAITAEGVLAYVQWQEETGQEKVLLEGEPIAEAEWMGYLTWSPDETLLAWLEVNGVAREIVVWDVEDGRVVVRFAMNADAGRPVWSPDGTQIAFTLGDSAIGDSQTWVYSLEDSHFEPFDWSMGQ